MAAPQHPWLAPAAALTSASALVLPLTAQAEPAAPDADLQAVNLCEMPAPNRIQVLVAADEASEFSQLFAQIQRRWPEATLCLDAPTAVSNGGLWIQVATVEDGDRAQAIAQEVSQFGGYDAILRAFRAEG